MQANKLILGTVQFGLNYGINNTNGKPNEENVFEIFNYAQKNNIFYLDTAQAYGNAVELIAKYHKTTNKKFNIITKFIYKDNFDVNSFVQQTLNDLQVNQLNTLMFHRYADLSNNHELLNELKLLQSKKIIENIGVSVYTNDEFENCINNDGINLIQLPFNLLDNVKQRGALIQKAKQKSKIIHTRSAFLQGLFFMKDNLPQKLNALTPYINTLHNIASKYNYSINELALNYAVHHNSIDNVLIGVDNLQQLQNNLQAISKGIHQNIIDEINCIAVKEIAILNPVNWN